MIRLIDKIIPEKDDNDTLQLAKWQIELCRHCMSVADLIQPGGNQFRGNYNNCQMHNKLSYHDAFEYGNSLVPGTKN